MYFVTSGIILTFDEDVSLKLIANVNNLDQ